MEKFETARDSLVTRGTMYEKSNHIRSLTE